MKIKTRNTLDSWENPAWLPEKPDWEYLRGKRVRQARVNSTRKPTKREQWIAEQNAIAKDSRQKLNIKFTSHQPMTIAQILGNPI